MLTQKFTHFFTQTLLKRSPSLHQYDYSQSPLYRALPHTMARQIKACLFDMDGTLLNTEDLYTKAASAILAKYGKGPLTWDIKLDLQGRPGPQAAEKLLAHYNLPLTVAEYVDLAADTSEQIWPESAWLPGALELLQYLKEKHVPMALGTGSNTLNYLRKTKHLRDFEMFGAHVVLGDDLRIPPGRGKPEPDVWHVCLESLNSERRELGLDEIAMEDCLVFEDGIPGVLSGQNANATVIWIPHPEALVELKGKEKTLVREQDEILGSLEEFDKAKYGL